jgi:hypothetical protein
MADPRTFVQNGFAPQYEQQQQQQFIDPSALQQSQQIHSHDRVQAQSIPRPYTLDEALPFTPFTTVFPFETGKCDCLPSRLPSELATSRDILIFCPRGFLGATFAHQILFFDRRNSLQVCAGIVL